MLIVGHEKQEHAIARVAERPLSVATIDGVAGKSLWLIALLIAMLALLYAIFEAEEKLRACSPCNGIFSSVPQLMCVHRLRGNLCSRRNGKRVPSGTLLPNQNLATRTEPAASVS